MEEKYKSDESFIARWVSGELSEIELSEFKKTEAFKDFKKINIISQELSAPPVDINKSLVKTKERIALAQKAQLRRRNLYWSIAASLILVVGLLGFFNSTQSYSTAYGEQLVVSLPDGSKVHLNSGTTLKHKRFFWNNNRNLSFEGEGFFEVEKGSDFVVKTKFGYITVLGTKFNIKARKNFDLKCFEGSVRFDNELQNTSKILLPNQAITIRQNIISNTTFNTNTPEWLQQKSSFKQIPLSEVLNVLTLQYDVIFKTNLVDLSRTFSGTFFHNDLEKALQSTLIPMNIEYEISSDKKVISLK